MPLVNAYSTLDLLKYRLRIGDVGDNAMLETLLTSASRTIDQWCGRRFYAATETRIYTPQTAYRLNLTYDLLSVTTLRTDTDGDRTYETLWTAGRDYVLLPSNAALDGEPYTAIEADRLQGVYTFPLLVHSVQIAGSWGYATTVPAPVEEATLRLAERLYKLRDAPLGVAGTAETGMIRIASDRDLDQLLWPYKRRRGFG